MVMQYVMHIFSYVPLYSLIHCNKPALPKILPLQSSKYYIFADGVIEVFIHCGCRDGSDVASVLSFPFTHMTRDMFT